MFDNVRTLSELLKTAIAASKRDLHVFDYHEDDGHGLYVADSEDSDFRVIIIPEVRDHMTQTLAGEKPAPAAFYNIYVPKYDSGDPSVGMDGYFYTDLELPWQWSFQSTVDVACKVMAWINDFEVNLQVSNHAEYLYYQEQENLEQV